jgi:hypothetical protein
VVVQVNHPRAGKSGYFDLSEFPDGAAFRLGFDALEILNGKRIADFEQTLADWFVLLGRGTIVTATGGSDSHHVVGQEVGYPRCWLGAGTDDPLAVGDADILRIVKTTRDVIVSNGPFITVREGGQSAIGRRFVRGKQPLVVEVTVQGAPWIATDRLEIWRDGTLIETRKIPAATTPLRLSERIPLDTPGAWVFVVRGDGSLDPVVPDDDSHAVTPIAVTNPIWLTPS